MEQYAITDKNITKLSIVIACSLYKRDDLFKRSLSHFSPETIVISAPATFVVSEKNKSVPIRN